MNHNIKKRQIRSFVLRAGRMSDRQQAALALHSQKYIVEFSAAPINFTDLFQRAAPTVLEIGYGMGDSLYAASQAFPHINFLGVEVHLPGVGNLMAKLAEVNSHNCKLIVHDAVEVLQQMIVDHSLARILIFFPDPWPKYKHHKRRLIQREFVDLLKTKLALDGELDIATDWEEYAKHILKVMRQDPTWQQLSRDRSEFRMPSKFERRGENLGHQIWDLGFRHKNK